MRQLEGFEWFDPREKECTSQWTAAEYVAWDLHYIRQCDILFVYAERTNSSCIGLSAEMGIALSLGKTTILVLAPEHLTHRASSLQFLVGMASVTLDTLESGLNYLRACAL